MSGDGFEPSNVYAPTEHCEGMTGLFEGVLGYGPARALYLRVTANVTTLPTSEAGELPIPSMSEVGQSCLSVRRTVVLGRASEQQG